MRDKLILAFLVILILILSVILFFIFSEFTFDKPFPKEHLYSLNYTLFIENDKAEHNINLPPGFESVGDLPFFLKLKYVNIDNSEYELYFNGNKLIPFNSPFKKPKKGIMQTDRFAVPKEITKKLNNHLQIIFKNNTSTGDIDLRFKNYYAAAGNDILIYQNMDDYEFDFKKIIIFRVIKFIIFVIFTLSFFSYLTALFLPLKLKKAFLINVFSAMASTVIILSLLMINAVYFPYSVFIYKNYLALLLVLCFAGISATILAVLFVRGKFDYGYEREIDRMVKAMLLVVDKAHVEIKKEKEEINKMPVMMIMKDAQLFMTEIIIKALLLLVGIDHSGVKKEGRKMAEILQSLRAPQVIFVIFIFSLILSSLLLILHLEIVAELIMNGGYFVLLFGVIFGFIKFLNDFKRKT